MLKKLFLLLSCLSFTNHCLADDFYCYDTKHNSSYTAASHDGVESDYDTERTRTQSIRERAKSIHEEESAKRDRLYTQEYESNVERQKNRNSLSTISQATQTVSQIANTAKYIQNLFTN